MSGIVPWPGRNGEAHPAGHWHHGLSSHSVCGSPKIARGSSPAARRAVHSASRVTGLTPTPVTVIPSRTIRPLNVGGGSAVTRP